MIYLFNPPIVWYPRKNCLSFNQGIICVFVDALFGVLDEADIRTVDDLARITPAKFRELMKLSSAMDKERQDVIWDAIRKLFEEGGNAFKQKLFRK